MDVQRRRPRQVPLFTAVRAGLDGATPLHGGSVGTVVRLTLAQGPVVVKTMPRPGAGPLEAEAAGLRRLRVVGGVPVPDVLAATGRILVLECAARSTSRCRALANPGGRPAR
ncbi:hypothetical protein ACIP88_17210 [Streptomyces uncialis]|uniref:hypothetical protein n=1 Tax=Streptomyces uncialis TaxID=1048205 RepID=UPI00381F0799